MRGDSEVQEIISLFFLQLGKHDLSAIIPSLVITALNLVLPVAFRLIGYVERYQHAQKELHINLLRCVDVYILTYSVVESISRHSINMLILLQLLLDFLTLF